MPLAMHKLMTMNSNILLSNDKERHKNKPKKKIIRKGKKYDKPIS